MYNTARNHIDEIIAALEYSSEYEGASESSNVLEQLSKGEVCFEETLDLLSM